MLWPLPLHRSHSVQLQMHNTETLFSSKMFSWRPTETIWSLVSGMCCESSWGKWALSWGLAFSNDILCLVEERGGASWPCLQHHNRWSAGQPRSCLLVPSSCYICLTLRLWLPGDRRFSQTPTAVTVTTQSRLKRLKPQYVQTHSSIKTLPKPKITVPKPLQGNA